MTFRSRLLTSPFSSISNKNFSLSNEHRRGAVRSVQCFFSTVISEAESPGRRSGWALYSREQELRQRVK